MKTLKHYLTLTLLLFLSTGYTQELTQTVRGRVVDFDTKTPIIGANIIIQDSDPFLGTTTDINGKFKLTNVPVGRIQLKVRSVSYQEIIQPNILVESGKEKVLNFEMLGDIQQLKQVDVSAQKDKSQAINKMATTSAKMFTVEETNRYAGSINDPARMVSAFAGVNGNPEGDNDIVVRGNSPRGILWRLEGIDIPNPNHFAGVGNTGGPVNALNGSMLANSDFFSGAFAPEYGDAISGVFDVKFRQGNNEKREYSFSAGIMGIDGTIEGPFKKGYDGSYLVNYRYSTLNILDGLGIIDFSGIPAYQDLSFKFVFPTKNIGTFSLIGLGGKSGIDEVNENEETEEIFGTYKFRANIGVVGLKHTYIINPKTYLKSYISGMTSYSGGEGENMNDNNLLVLANKEGFTDDKLKTQSILNYKHNQKNTIQIGATHTILGYNYFFDLDDNEDGTLKRFIDSKGNTEVIQSFLSWKYRLNNQLTFVSGMHYTQLFLNNKNAIEPRLGMNWNAAPRHNFSMGFGLHSKVENASTYQYNERQADDSFYTPNANLGLSKSMHSVAGYSFQINENVRFKTEVYYQHLYNVPIENQTNSNYSIINSTGGLETKTLINEGTGRNYGTELTLERFFNNSFYYLVTGSIYKSKYTALDGIERNSRFDANYASNLLIGKEFKLKPNKTLSINTKVSLLGGNRFTPIDMEASQLAGYQIRKENEPFTSKGEDVFFLNLGLTYRVNKPKASHSFKIDVQNLTNNQATVMEYYNSRTKSIEKSAQLSLIPNLIYTIKF